MSYEYDEVKHHGRRFNHRKDEEEAVDSGFSETTEVSEVIVAPEPQVDHKKEEKHHKHLELLAGLGAAAAGTYALHENSEAKKDLEHGHNHKTKEEIGAVAAVAAGGFAFHEHHEKNEAKEADEEAYGKRHHQRIFG